MITYPVPTVVTFTTAGANSWTAPAGVTSISVEVWGGGGGGGGDNNTVGNGAGGGGGGAYARLDSFAVTPGTGYAYTVGGAGSAGAANDGPGGTGGNSFFVNTLTLNAVGGVGGAGGDGTAGGAGGLASSSTGDFKTSGGSGRTSAVADQGGGGGGSGGTAVYGTTATGTAGAGAVTGGGPGGSGGSDAAGSAPASVPGGGGGGGGASSGSRDGTDRAGGAGRAGQVRITYKNVPTLTVGNSPVTYNGSPQQAVVNASVAGTVGDIKYNGSSTIPTAMGIYAVTADFAPTDTASYFSLNDASAGNFLINPAITASAGANGTISPLGVTSVTYNGSQLYTITPNSGYVVNDVLVDGSSVGLQTSYMFSSVTANHTISVTFVSVSSIAASTATVGAGLTYTVTGSSNKLTYTFTAGSGTFTPASGLTGDVLVLAGGGGGGGAETTTDWNEGGGGGGGGFVEQTGISLTSGTITVGNGGTSGTASARGGSGGNSAFGAITANGGGGGGSGYSDPSGSDGSNGGSGGGGARAVAYGQTGSAGTGTSGQGFNGDGGGTGRGGGGGGAGAASVAGSKNGGTGKESSITLLTYAGGGGAGTFTGGGGGGPAGTGGSGGGGAGFGANATAGNGVAGIPNTGGGGGGGGNGSQNGVTVVGGAGGSGVVILRYTIKATPTVTVTVGTYNFNNSPQGPVASNVNTGGSTGGVTLSYLGVGPTTYAASSTRPTAAGTYTVTATVQADSNYYLAQSSATSFSIIPDTTNPTITCVLPDPQNRDTDPGVCTYTVQSTEFDPTAFGDNVPGATISYVLTGDTIGSGATTLAGVVFNKGTTTVTWTVTDTSGNDATCNFDVVVVDNTAPVAVCQAVTIQVDGTGNATLSASQVNNNSTDNCAVTVVEISKDGMSWATSLSYTCTDLGSGNTVTLRVKDAADNENTCNATVTVVDNTAPVISGCPGDITRHTDSGESTAVVSWTAPTAGDNCGMAAVDGLTSTHNPGDTFPQGETTVTYTATDAAGNQSTCSFKVTVVDEEIPEITCPSDITVSNGLGQCGSVVTYTAPEGTDNSPGATTALTLGLPSGSMFPVGTTTVTYTVTDASNNSASCSFDVTVNDTERPQIACPGNISVNNAPGLCSAVVTWSEPVPTDNCGILSVSSNHHSGDSFPVGTTTVTYTVTDIHSNVEHCTFDVTVTDTEKPVITCPAPISINNALGLCSATTVITPPTATDNCGFSGVVMGTRSDSLLLSDPYPLGVTLINWTASDSDGNSAVPCIQTVTVNDNEPPVVTQCAASQNAIFDGVNLVPVPVFTGEPVDADDCTTIEVTQSPTAGTLVGVGVHTVTLTFKDVALNQSTCQATFEVTSAVALNNEPVGANNTVTTNEDTDKTFTAANFGFSDPNDTPANVFLAVKITTLPGLGTLKNNGVPVGVGAFVTVADINANRLKFTPVANASGAPYTTFTFQGQDDGGTTGGGVDLDQSPNRMRIDVTAVNDAPTWTTLPPAGISVVNEGSLLTFPIAANPNDAGQTVQYSIVGVPPAGASVHPTTGVFTWTPNSSQGGVIYQIKFRATDNGSPNLSVDTATKIIRVNDVPGVVNYAPNLSNPGIKIARRNQALSFSVNTSDQNTGQSLTYSFVSGFRAGMTITPNPVVVPASRNTSTTFSWTPTVSPGIYPVRVRVVDNGSPSKADEESFVIVVFP